MIENKFEIKSDDRSGALLRLFNSRVDGGKRPLVDHHHTMCEISLVKKGHGVYVIGEPENGNRSDSVSRELTLEPGDIFVFAGDRRHCITEIDGELLIMNIHFEPRFIWSPGNGLFDAKYLRIFTHDADGVPGSFAGKLERGSLHSEIVELMLSMEREFEEAEPEYELMVKIRLLNLLVLLSRSRGISDDRSHVDMSPNLKALDSVMQYIDENLAAPLSLDELSRHAGMSRSYFSTTFKRLNGITPWDYITAKRIEKSVTLLESTELSIIEVAGLCGFNSTANFNRAFRKMTGRAPTELRRHS